jgi:hypothetical protein
VPVLDAATAAAAAAVATAPAATAATATASSALTTAATPHLLRLPRLLLSPHLRFACVSDVLLPTAGAVHAAATFSTLDADWLQQAGAAATQRRQLTTKEKERKS